MDEQHQQNTPRTDGVHPAVLQVTGDDTRRWCAAVWSVGPDKQALVGEIRGLVESTLVAHWMQPPAQYEPTEEFVNSFDLLFWDTDHEELERRLREDGWRSLRMEPMVTEEYEQFEALEEEARKAGRSVSRRPEALWRIGVDAPDSDAVDLVELEQRVAEMLGDEIWGDQPGWISKAYCETLQREGGPQITPDRDGLAVLENCVFEGGGDALHRPGAMAFQAVCDFIGVVLQTEGTGQVQWGTCPVDEETGFAPAPLLRISAGAGNWQRLLVGRDVARAAAVPWGREDGAESNLVRVVEDYLDDTGG